MQTDDLKQDLAPSDMPETLVGTAEQWVLTQKRQQALEAPAPRINTVVSTVKLYKRPQGQTTTRRIVRSTQALL